MIQVFRQRLHDRPPPMILDLLHPVLPPIVVVPVVVFVLTVLYLPGLIVRLRNMMLTRINGDSGVQFPRSASDASAKEWHSLYNDKHNLTRSIQAGVGLSDLYWYFLSPGPDIHQEHVESGTALYAKVAGATKVMLAVPTGQLREMARRYASGMFANAGDGPGDVDGNDIASLRPFAKDAWTVVRLRDSFFPVFSQMFHEMLFGCRATKEDLAMLVSGASNVIDTIKCTEMRDMGKRRPMTDYVQARLNQGLCAAAAQLTKGMTEEERALHIQGVFLTSGVIQMSEAMAHVCLAIASSPEVRCKLEEEQRRNQVQEAETKKRKAAAVEEEQETEMRGNANADASKTDAQKRDTTADEDAGPDRTYLDMTLKEVLRLYPLFGIAHRISSAPIALGGSSDKEGSDGPKDGKGSTATVLPKGTVLCFNYLNYQMIGHKNAKAFRPERWARGNKKERSANYAPFGVMRNRPCPGQRVAQILMLEMTDVIMSRVHFAAPIPHSRSLPGKGLCAVVRRQRTQDSYSGDRNAAGVCVAEEKGVPEVGAPPVMRIRVLHAVDTLGLSLKTLVYGTAMAIRAKQLKLAYRYTHERVISCPRNTDLKSKPQPVPRYHYEPPATELA